MIIDANAHGEVRGYASNPQTHFDLNEQGKLDVRRAVGTEGMLSIVKDLGLRDFFTGQVPIVSGEIAEDFTEYFVVSEQVPSAVGLGVLVNPDNTVKAAGRFHHPSYAWCNGRNNCGRWKSVLLTLNRFRH